MRALASLSRPTIFALALSACDERTAADAAQASEVPSRTWQSAALLPAFSAPALASFGDKVVLVGGDERWRTERALETWQFDGTRWEQLRASQAPPARQRPGLARFQDQLLMFGGKETSLTPDFADYVNETWTWNGVDWTQLQLAQSPPGRSAPAMTSWGGQILLFGGQSSSGALQDTWRWGGTHWTLLQSVDGPKDCESPAARLGATVVMFCNARTVVWDGVGWNERVTSTRPSRRRGHVLASFGERVLMYGGYADSGNTQETWEWDGTDWRDRTSSPSPAMREGYQLTQLADKLVLHGGGESQTWMWDGERWSLATLPTMPAARRDYAIATFGERVIVFGGCCRADVGSRAQYWDDTWAWDGEHWRELQPPQRPAARASARLAAIGGKLVMFGGRGSDGLLADTWELEGETWRERQLETHPPARQHYALAAYRGAVVLFGGASSDPPTTDSALADMWQWDGSSWRQLSFSAGPKPGYRHALAGYGEELALFSGSFAELWFWNGEAWTRRELGDDHAPIPESAVYMAQLGSRLVAGGLSEFGFGLRTREWDGARWSDESFLAQSVGPITGVGETLVGLGGAPLRTWIYASR
jgi:N-acetylneuraminic acid mutarotase